MMLSSDTKHNTLSLTSIPNPNPPRKRGKEKKYRNSHAHACTYILAGWFLY